MNDTPKMQKLSKISIFLLSIISCHVIFAQSQYPSPIEEHSRAHERVEKIDHNGLSFEFENLLPKPIEVYIPNKKFNCDSTSLIIHFHGSSYVPKYAVDHSDRHFILATVNLGHGSSAYEKPFIKNDKFVELINTISDSLNMIFENIYISSFSAGYGAVRAILNNSKYFKIIDGVILLDGLHTDYYPDRLTIADGGKLNIDKLSCFLELANQAINENKTLIITHSEIFPGTYASTTETANYLINELGLNRKSILKWGVIGMQQTSEVSIGNFHVFGFAGNTAPDHIDHFHALYSLIQFLK